ncbi:MAG: hypothetical protein Q9163_000994 [Psora crenata]
MTLLQSPQMMEILNTAQLETYLKANDIDFKSVRLLEGGTCNFVFRMINEAGQSVIIKHAEPYVATNPQMAFTTDRMDFEYKALCEIPKHMSHNPLVSPPQVHRYDAENHVLIMDDGGARTLKAAYIDPAIDVVQIGQEIGRWLAGFHANTKSVDIGDNQPGKAIYRYVYYTMADTLREHGFDPALGERIDRDYGSLLLTDDECVCHGDCWPGNFLLGEENKLTVVDWEMTRRGCRATDVGQFAAEASLLDRFRGGSNTSRGLLPAFLQGYRDLDQGHVDVKRVAVHMGAHLICWPVRMAWGTKEEMRLCIQLGIEMIQAAVSDDWAWLRKSALKDLM